MNRKPENQFLSVQRVGKMAQWSRVLAAFFGGLTLAASTHIGQLTTSCNSRSREPNTLFRPLQVPTHAWGTCT